MNARQTILAALALFAAGPTVAVRVANAPPPSDAVRPASAASATVDESNSLREGVITNVSEKRDQVMINGSWLKIVDGKTRVFRQGRAVNGGDELVKGKQVRFTVAPGATAADGLTLGVVYVP